MYHHAYLDIHPRSKRSALIPEDNCGPRPVALLPRGSLGLYTVRSQRCPLAIPVVSAQFLVFLSSSRRTFPSSLQHFSFWLMVGDGTDTLGEFNIHSVILRST